MWQWVAANKDLLIALFGGGGAGVVMLTMFARKSGENTSKGPVVTATAGPGGVSAAHGGTGNIDIRLNEPVGSEAITELKEQLNISLTEAARLLKAFNAAGLDLAAGKMAVARVSADSNERPALLAALRDDDIARAAFILARAAAPRMA